MELYIDYTGYRSVKKLLQKYAQAMPDEPINLHLRAVKSPFVFSLAFLMNACKKICNIELTEKIENLSRFLVWYANIGKNFKLKILVSRAITKKQWKMCKRLQKDICIIDVSGVDNSKWYNECRRVVILNEGEAGVCEAEVYAAIGGAPTTCCELSSCLGKTLYIAPNADVSVCPKDPQATVIGNLDADKDVFDTPRFHEYREAAAQKQASCTSCVYAQICHGGCALHPRCEEMKKACEAAIRDMNEIIQNTVPLSELPLYKEKAILYYLLTNGNNVDNDIPFMEEK